MIHDGIVQFLHREPIGSSTFPMPVDSVDVIATNSRFLAECTDSDRITSVYLHIPFCDQICSFCAFNKFQSNEEQKARYVQDLIKEITLYGRKKYVQSTDIKSIYIGGGTPNSLSAQQLDELLSALKNNLRLDNVLEITCEGTPQNFTEERIAILKKHGVNRVSAGIQTFNAQIRK